MVPFWESMFCPALVTATVSTPCNSAPALHAAFAEATGRRDGIGGRKLKSAALVSTVAAALICKQPKRSRARKTVCFASELAGSGSGSGSLKIDGAYFVDEEKRIVLFGSFPSSNSSRWCNTFGWPNLLPASRCVICGSALLTGKAWPALAKTVPTCWDL